MNRGAQMGGMHMSTRIPRPTKLRLKVSSPTSWTKASTCMQPRHINIVASAREDTECEAEATAAPKCACGRALVLLRHPLKAAVAIHTRILFGTDGRAVRGNARNSPGGVGLQVGLRLRAGWPRRQRWRSGQNRPRAPRPGPLLPSFRRPCSFKLPSASFGSSPKSGLFPCRDTKGAKNASS